MARVETRHEDVASRRDPDRSRVELTLLGGFAVACSGVAVPLPTSAQRLVAFLALQQRPVSRSFAAGSLWGDSTEEHATGSLRSVLWRVRRDPGRLVDATGAAIGLAPGVEVDLHEVSGLARRLLAGEDFPGDARVQVERLDHDLLPGWYDEWVVMPRERNRQLRLHALEALAETLARRGSYAEAVEAGLAAVESEPLRESAHAVLIRVHLAEGNREEALRQFDRYRAIMRSSLDLEPSARVAALIAGVTSR